MDELEVAELCCVEEALDEVGALVDDTENCTLEDVDGNAIEEVDDAVELVLIETAIEVLLLDEVDDLTLLLGPWH